MKQKIIPIVSVLIGVLAFLLTHQYLANRQRELDQLKAKIFESAKKVYVVYAVRDIPGGAPIKEADIDRRQVYEMQVPDSTVFPEEGRMILGKKAAFTIKKDQIMTWRDIEGGSEANVGLAPMIQSGLRAVSLSIAGAAAVSSMVQPNDRVDVLGTFSFPSRVAPGQMETVTLTVLQDVTVLATGQRLAKRTTARQRAEDAAGYSTVTVEVTPREAELLVFAQQMQGRLTLALRNPADVSFENEVAPVNFDYLQNKLPELNNYRQRTIRHKSGR